MVTWRRLGELIVPAIVLLGCLLYWWHVQDARSVARRVPDAVILFTVALTIVALVREFLFPPTSDDEKETPASFAGEIFVKRVLFVLLCFGYFLGFSWLGFNLTNVIFLLLAYRLAGLSFLGALPAAIISSAIFHFLALLMDFRVPTGPFGF